MGGCIIIIWASTWLLKITSIETLRETAPPWRLCLLSNESTYQSLGNTSVSVLGYDRIPLEYSFSAVSWIFLAAIRRVLDNVLTILMVHKGTGLRFVRNTNSLDDGCIPLRQTFLE